MAGTTGLEPATSAVTGQRSNQLNYVPDALFRPEALSVAPALILLARPRAEAPAGQPGTVTIPLLDCSKQNHAPANAPRGN